MRIDQYYKSWHKQRMAGIHKEVQMQNQLRNGEIRIQRVKPMHKRIIHKLSLWMTHLKLWRKPATYKPLRKQEVIK